MGKELLLRSEGVAAGFGEDAHGWAVGRVFGDPHSIWVRGVCVQDLCEEEAETKSWCHLVHLGCFS